MNASPKSIKVLMVCLGNICRSPTAQGIFEKYVEESHLKQHIEVDSAGTGNWHIGESPDIRSLKAAARRGYDISGQRARQIEPDDYTRFDYILAMDIMNLKELERDCPPRFRQNLRLFMTFGDFDYNSVPDPYHSGPDGFELVLDLVEEASQNLLDYIIKLHDLRSDQ